MTLNNLVNYSAQVYTTVKACCISCAFWKDVLRQSFKSYKTWKRNLVDMAKKLSDVELIIKFASSSVGERIFRDLRSKIYIPSEEKTSADGENGRLIALK